MTSYKRLGLTATEYTKVRKKRRLPVPGEVVVKQGDTVSPDTLVAVALVPGFPLPINVALKLGVEAEDIGRYMFKQEGEEVREGDILAQRKLLMGLSEETVRASIDGTVESISFLTGMVVLRSHPVRVETTAYLGGEVVEVLEQEGVTIEAPGAYLQGIFGVGGENSGEIIMGVASPQDIIDNGDLTAAVQGKIIVGGSFITLAALKKARRLGACGVIVGGICDKDLESFVGHKIGLAITGQERIDLSIIVTEGFGQIDMSNEVFAILKANEGRMASINGTTHIRAETVRPEIIIPALDASDSFNSAPDQKDTTLGIGSLVMIIRHPYFGHQGHIIDMQPEGPVPSEIGGEMARVALEDGSKIVVPISNLELR